MSIDYTIVIPHRNEIIVDEDGQKIDLLAWTIQNILDTSEPTEIIPVEDVNGDGTGPTRHRGMVKAKTEVVITCDAHMTFEEGALDRLAELVAKDPLTVGCLSCCTNESAAITDVVYCGADLYETSENHPLDAKWRKSPNNKPGEIACVMGACYGLSRTLYDKIGQPWRIGRGWGCDEQLISIPARLIGGRVEVLEDKCGHLFRSDKDVMFRRTPEEFRRTWYTRQALLHYLNMDNLPELLANCVKHAGAELAPEPDVLEARAVLESNRVLDWCDYRRRWIICNTELRQIPPEQITTTAGRGRPMPRRAEPPADDYGIECPHCHTVSDRHCVTTVYKSGIRRRICIHCRKPFSSRFVGN